jgi:CDP-glucose 4,6-dehydratase
VVQGALEDLDAVQRALDERDVDTVFHLGAQALVGLAYANPLATFEANIRGTANVLEACRRRLSRMRCVVVASSDKAYGVSTSLPYTEDSPLAGRYPYDASKACADILAQSYASTYGLRVAIARCGNIFGGGDTNWSRLVPGVIRSLLQDARPVVRSDGSPRRDYVYINDAVAAYMAIAEGFEQHNLAGHGFNFGPDASHSVLDVIRELQVVTQRDLAPEILNTARAEIPDQHLDSRKARTMLGWAPKYALRDGLERTVAWYARYLEKRDGSTY